MKKHTKSQKRISTVYRKFVTAEHSYAAFKLVESLTPLEAVELLKLMAVEAKK
ncbi:hypothetical protein [Bacillus piscicola]|uniref:hypothetical protein n=1 Tax=Bacillus piscicola TaxID=1632684 RepID=UPI001F0988AC|nr:hypothetical protein [Bacillus piscicola]